jgi:hypothetical protein
MIRALIKTISFQPIDYKLIAAFFMSSMSFSALGDDQPANRWLSISFDNDIFVGTDGGYASWFYLLDTPQTESELPWYFWLQSKLTNTTKDGRQVQIQLDLRWKTDNSSSTN